MTAKKRLVGLHAARGRSEDSLKIVSDILKESPSDRDARRTLAALSALRGDSASLAVAKTEYAKLSQESTNDAQLRFEYGIVLTKLNDNETAKKQFLEALRVLPGYTDAQVMLGELSLQEKPSDSIRYAGDILAQHPRNPRALLLRGRALIATRQFEEAAKELNGLARLYPRAQEPKLYLGLAYVGQRKINEAQKLFQELSSSDNTDFRSVSALAGVMAMKKQFDEALVILQTEIRKNPGNIPARLGLASIAARAGRIEMAAAEYEALIKQYPQSGDLYRQQGLMYASVGHQEKALESLTRALELNPKNPDSYTMLGSALEQAGRFQEAGALYRRGLQATNSNHAGLLNNLAYVIAEGGGDLNEALSLVQKALASVKDHPALLDTLAWVYVKQNKPVPALQILDRLTAKSPDLAAFRYHRGVALVAAERKQEARKELEAALAANPSPVDAKSIQQLLIGLK